ncbi:hypothetical protein [Dokdonella sp.]|uniref:hypothetical protein n=1 Tax=Dokdonella sp. TaxID=2291710 RepID=UPI0025C2D11D|nr:hypothetical protein [Dokdonella sp.]
MADPNNSIKVMAGVDAASIEPVLIQSMAALWTALAPVKEPMGKPVPPLGVFVTRVIARSAIVS